MVKEAFSPKLTFPRQKVYNRTKRHDIPQCLSPHYLDIPTL